LHLANIHVLISERNAFGVDSPLLETRS
jgi:hypothetical protein